jgi:hypothetical protein
VFHLPAQWFEKRELATDIVGFPVPNQLHISTGLQTEKTCIYLAEACPLPDNS